MKTEIILMCVLIGICYVGFGLNLTITLDSHDSIKEIKSDEKISQFTRFLFFLFWPILMGLPIIFGALEDEEEQ